MTEWTLELTESAEQELKALPADFQARFLHIAELLESLGPSRVREPHVKHLEGKLWEIRLRGKDGIARAIYFTKVGKRLCVVRIFVKKTQKTPRSEIEMALKRMAEEKHDGENAHEP